MFRERFRKGVRERCCECFVSSFEFQKGTPKDNGPKDNGSYSNRLLTHHPYRSAHGSSTGNRGFARHPWWRGPREPPPLKAVMNHGGVVSLFIDGISSYASRFDLKKIFSKVGVVADIYISKKRRKNSSKFFGFVRFFHLQEAKLAVNTFDGRFVLGSKIRVSMARYKKDGTSIAVSQSAGKITLAVHRGLKHQPHSESRRYAVVTMGKKRQVLKSNDANVMIKTTEEARNLKPSELLENGEVREDLREVSNPILEEKSERIDGKSLSVLEASDMSTEIIKEGAKVVETLKNSLNPQETCTINQPAASTMPPVPVVKKTSGKVRRITNPKDIKLFLGYYSSSREKVTQKGCVA